MHHKILFAFFALIVLGCSSPGPLDGGASDAGNKDAGQSEKDAGQNAKDAGLGDGGRPFDIFEYVPDSGIGSMCNACLQANSCGLAINGCLNKQVCTAGLGCTVGRCLANAPETDGGWIDAGWRLSDGGIEVFGCALSCFNGDFVVTLQALGATACAAGCLGTCSSDFLTPIFGPPDGGVRLDGGFRFDAGQFADAGP
jgi:hypothetical protein